MPLPGVMEVVGGLSAQEQCSWLEESERKLEREIERMSVFLEHRRVIRQYLNMMLEKNGITEEVDWREPFYGLYFLGVRGRTPPQKLIEQWSANMPFTYLTVKIPLEELREEGRREAYHTEVGLGVIEKWRSYCNLPAEPPVQVIPGGKSVRIFVKTENLFDIKPADIQPLLDYVKERGYEYICNSSGWVIVSEFEPDRTVYHVLIRVRVQ